MGAVISVLLQQWPSMALIVAGIGGFWAIFNKWTKENQNILRSYSELVEKHKEDSDRYRVIVRSLIDDNERMRKAGDEMKDELSRVVIENRNLRRVVDRIEEMIRAVGGDFKVISKQITSAREDIKIVSDRVDSIFLLESKDKKQNG